MPIRDAPSLLLQQDGTSFILLQDKSGFLALKLKAAVSAGHGFVTPLSRKAYRKLVEKIEAAEIAKELAVADAQRQAKEAADAADRAAHQAVVGKYRAEAQQASAVADAIAAANVARGAQGAVAATRALHNLRIGHGILRAAQTRRAAVKATTPVKEPLPPEQVDALQQIINDMHKAAPGTDVPQIP